MTMKLEFPYGASLALKAFICVAFASTVIGLALGVLLGLPFVLYEYLSIKVAQLGRFLAAWYVAKGRDILKRIGVRVVAVVFLPLLFLGWVAAAPYASLEYYSRRDHFEDGRSLFFSKKGWRDIGRLIRTGRIQA